jgi:23S rRNA (adenine2030-N6)-methyltransferase
LLSYRHAFHAGNFADVLKHVVLVEILRHLVRKAGGFHYIDTHAGAGLYDLKSARSGKLQEYRGGIGKLSVERVPELAPYLAIVGQVNEPGALDYYPGSPLFARHFLRPVDRAWLYELHSADFALLGQRFAGDDRVRVMQADGFKGLLSLLPPVSRRALVLMDPAYEVKADYEQVFASLSKAHEKFSTGIYALWYPVVDRSRIDELEKKFAASGMRKIQRFELGIRADGSADGLTAAGMIVINPPWTLLATMAQLLPRLVDCLSCRDDAFYRCDVLAAE